MIPAAFLLALHLLPALYSVAEFGLYPYWVLSGIALPLCLLRMRQSLGWTWVSLASGLVACLNVLLLVSLVFQGSGFNDAFFYHLDMDTLLVAKQQYTLPLISACVYILLCTVLPRWARLQQSPPIPAWLLISLALLCFAPAWSLVSGLPGQLTSKAPAATSVRPDVELNSSTQQRPNLVLIYAESLEQLYFNKELFGPLLPELSQLRGEALDFTGLQQVDGTGWTIAGIVASQCGVPLLLEGSHNNALAAIAEPLPGINCLGDILAAHGYHNVYMGGASLRFAGKGNFLSAHGYHEVLGQKDLEDSMENPDYQTGWGLYDDNLLALAQEKLDELAQSKQPFMLTLLTLDTHHPDGHPSASCKPLPDKHASMANAIYCTDQLLAAFLKELSQSPLADNTIIAVVSDHLAMRNQMSEILNAHQSQRRLSFFVLGSGRREQTINRAGTHYDIAPTLLNLMGITNYAQLNQGASLLGPVITLPAPNLNAQTTLFGKRPQLGDIQFNTRGPGIRINGQDFIPTAYGYGLRDKIFAVRFNASGDFNGFITARNRVDLSRQAQGDFLVGLSNNVDFNSRHLGSELPERNHYYLGYPDTRSEISGLLWWQTDIERETVMKIFRSRQASSGSGG